MKSTKNMKKIIRRNRKGFTLLELMIVIVILGLLATIIMPKILNRPEQARYTKAMVEIKNIESALALFKTDTGRFPTTSEGLLALVSNSGNIKNYNSDGYLDNVPLDPWGNPYIYICPSVHGKYYDLESYGKDGENGGTDFNADIESWNLDQSTAF
ncbi:MAG: type II secretion system major pseudopilin GspG [Sedimentisphaerales bacterium]|nr:type II secretion system major pseudopilin GspG [Sedimentisphaerales bacterium]